VNEPWWLIPLEELKDFYWESYKIVQSKAPQWITLFHDSFRLWPSTFGGDWMKNCNNWAMDTHLYQAWSDPASSDAYVSMTCGAGSNLRLMERLGVPVIVGEWSLATDNCAMWLNGLNDNVPGFPKQTCRRLECLASYMGEQPGAPPRLDPATDTMDPRGSGGESFVINGTCPVSGHSTIDSVRKLAYAQLNVFDLHTHGNFFWNFRTELEPLWDYQQAVKNKWIPIDYSNHSEEQPAINSACLSMDENDEVSSLSRYSISYRSYVIVTILLVIVISIRRWVSLFRQLLAPTSPYQPIPAASELSDIEFRSQA
jgi:glucan 1,3-beta-glucosidase